MSTYVSIDDSLASNGYTLSGQLQDPKASYLFWDLEVLAEAAPW